MNTIALVLHCAARRKVLECRKTFIRAFQPLLSLFKVALLSSAYWNNVYVYCTVLGYEKIKLM